MGVGQTGFAGYKAANLRRALETMSTIPIPAPTKFTLAPILGWMGYVILRRFGYVAQNFSPDDPIVIQRNKMDRPTVPLGKRRKP